VEGALRTIEGYEAMHLIRKVQIRWLQKGEVVGQCRFIHATFGIVECEPDLAFAVAPLFATHPVIRLVKTRVHSMYTIGLESQIFHGLHWIRLVLFPVTYKY
jgi:hypothetical protein